MSIWLIYVTVNKLPYAKRMNSENMIFVCLWFSEKKPYIQSLKALKNGVEISSLERGKFLWVVCVCNSMQFGGEYGYRKCLETVKTGVLGHSRAFLYQNGNPKCPLRTAVGV